MSKKTITINPELFKISNSTRRTSRKKHDDDDNAGSSRPQIKIRNPAPKTNTIKRKNHVLRFIRDQQEKNYKKMLDDPAKETVGIIKDFAQEFSSDFDESLRYMISLTDEQKQANDLRNRTLKQRPLTSQSPVIFNPSIPTISEVVNVSVPEVFDTTLPYGPLKPPAIPHQQPLYGCLKKGNLPTYRQYHNLTQRRAPHNDIQPPIHIPSSSTLTTHTNDNNHINTINSDIFTNNAVDQMNQIKKTAEKKYNIDTNFKPKIKYPKQRRTIRRTYRLGKSKIHPKITVLVSNRTLRNNITTKSQLLKQTSIPEIKRFLIKKGFIKVGSSAPNDVLRKMYESASLICGEVQNHNPENLLYNYFNDIESIK